MRVIVYRFTGRHGFFTVPERWCEECDLTVRAVDRVAAEFPGTEVEVRPWFLHLPAALFHGVWHPPGVVVDGRRIIQTKVPSDDLLREALRCPTPPPAPRLAVLGAVLAWVAAFLHVLVAPEHFEAWWGYGVFFVLVALAQAVLGWALLRRPGAGWYAAGLVGTLAVVGLYVVTRTAGIPVGPETGEVEAVGLVDVVSKTAEAALVLVLAALLARRVPAPSPAGQART